tara:strand:- start:1686 stop:2285 length:600 start_codon:yes stop_codon:yes gene_type:complete
MGKKAIIQYLILLTIIIIIGFVYLNYFKTENKKEILGLKKKIEKNIPKNSKDLINDLIYSSEDRKGNKYQIKSKEGEIDSKQKNIITMKDVTAEIMLVNGEVVYISSEKAKYNNDNYDTLFQGSVMIKYNDKSINSEYLDLSFENKIAKLQDDVIYESNTSKLKADKILVDLINMSTKFLMNDKNKKVSVKTTIDNGNN